MSSSHLIPTKLLVVVYYYYPYVSGLSETAKDLAEEFARQGYEVVVLTSSYDKQLPKEEIHNNVKIIRHPVLLSIGKGPIMPTYWLDIIRYARKSDYVHFHLPMVESGLSALFIPKQKQVTNYHCDIFLGSGIIAKFMQLVSMSLMHLQLRRSRVVVPSTRDYLEHSKMRRYLAKAHPIYPPIPSSDFKPVDASSLYKRLAVDKNEVKIGFVGRIVYEKGIQYLLEAIPEIQKEIPRFKIIIAGDYKKVAGGSIKDRLDKFLTRYPDNILFTGYLSDAELNKFYSGLDLLVLPSIDPLEAFGMVQVEAMLCGTPVVASNLPGVREAVRKTGYGLICQPKNPKDIAKKILAVVAARQKYTPDRKKVIEVFNPRESYQQYLNLMPRRLKNIQ